MHKLFLAPASVQKAIAKRGRRHVFSDLAPTRTALLVIDLQNAYLDESLNNTFCANALDIVPNVNRVAAMLRRVGGVVVWIQNTATKESLASWSMYNDVMLTQQRRDKRFAGISNGSPGHNLWRGLDVQADDLRVTKTRYSAFIQGSSNLEPQLRQRGIDTVIVTGTGTGTCCESTARDAMMLNFATIMLSDANACGNDEEHSAALSAFYRSFGDVMTTDELLRYIEINASVTANSHA